MRTMTIIDVNNLEPLDLENPACRQDLRDLVQEHDILKRRWEVLKAKQKKKKQTGGLFGNGKMIAHAEMQLQLIDEIEDQIK